MTSKPKCETFLNDCFKCKEEYKKDCNFWKKYKKKLEKKK